MRKRFSIPVCVKYHERKVNAKFRDGWYKRKIIHVMN